MPVCFIDSLPQQLSTWTLSLELLILCFVSILSALKDYGDLVENSRDWAVRSPCCHCSSDLAPGLRVLLSPCPVPLHLSGCFDKLPNTPGWRPSFAVILLIFLWYPALKIWTCQLVIDISLIAHVCKHCLCRDPLVLFLAYFYTKYACAQILRVLVAPLIVCMLSVIPYQSHTPYNFIIFQQVKFISWITHFQFLPTPHFKYHFLREALPDIPNMVKCHYLY